MSREFTMGAKLSLSDAFSGPIKAAARATSTFRQSVERSHQATEQLKQSTFGLRDAVVALAAGAAAKKGFDWLVGANADMEQYQNTLSVVLKSQDEAVKTLAWAQKFAAKTPFEIPQIVEATTRMQSYGISAQKTLGIVGDMASVMGKDLLQAVEAVADAQTGELERLKEFSITKKMIQDQAKAMGSNPINNQGQITDTKAFNAALFALMEQRFKGGMEMQSKTWRGMLSNAKDFMGSLGRQLGQPLFERSKKQLQSFLDTLNRLQSDGTVDRWIKQAQQAGAVVGRVFQSAYQVTVSAFRGIGAVVGPIIDGIKRNWSTWGPIIETAGYALAAFSVGLGAVKTALGAASVAMRLLNVAMLTNPIGWVILGISLLIGLFVKMNGGVDGAKKAFMGWLTQLKAWGQVFVGFINQVKAYWPQIQATIVGVITAIWAKVGPVVNMIATDIVNAFNSVVNWVQTYWPGIQRYFTLVWAIILPYIQAALAILKSIFINGFNLIVGVISGAWQIIRGIIKVAWSIISGVIGVGMAILMGDWGKAWDSFLSIFTGVWNGIKDIFGGIGTIFYDAGKAIINTLVDGIKAVASAPVKAIKNVFEEVRKWLPFSDAKKGPLSELTYSGGAIMTTLSTGVTKRAGSLQDAVGSAFSGTGLNISPNAIKTTPKTASATVAPATAAAPIINVGGINVHAAEGMDTKEVAHEVIDQIYGKMKDVARSLTTSDKELLFR